MRLQTADAKSATIADLGSRYRSPRPFKGVGFEEAGGAARSRLEVVGRPLVQAMTSPEPSALRWIKAS